MVISVVQAGEREDVNVDLMELESLEEGAKIEACIRIVKYYKTQNLDSCRIYAAKLSALVEMGSNLDRFRSFKLLGLMNAELRSFTLAMKYFRKAELEILSVENNDLDLAILYNDIGVTFLKQERYTESMLWFSKSEKLAYEFAEVGDDLLVLLNIGFLLEKQKKFKESRAYYDKYEKFLIKKNDSKEALANLYNRIGSYYLDLDSIRLSKKHFLKADSVYQMEFNQRHNANSITNLAIIDFIEGRTGKALTGFQLALKLRKNNGRKEVISEGLLNLGDYYYRLNNNDEALRYFHDAYFMALEGKSIQGIKDAADYLINAYRKVGKNEKIISLLLQLNDDVEDLQIAMTNVRLDEMDHFSKVDKLDRKKFQLLDSEENKSCENKYWIFMTGALAAIFMLTTIVLLMKLKKGNAN
jgi:tetratricopeptide (TPR) repeat protein